MIIKDIYQPTKPIPHKSWLKIFVFISRLIANPEPNPESVIFRKERITFCCAFKLRICHECSLASLPNYPLFLSVQICEEADLMTCNSPTLWNHVLKACKIPKESVVDFGSDTAASILCRLPHHSKKSYPWVSDKQVLSIGWWVSFSSQRVADFYAFRMRTLGICCRHSWCFFSREGYSDFSWFLTICWVGWLCRFFWHRPQSAVS